MKEVFLLGKEKELTLIYDTLGMFRSRPACSVSKGQCDCTGDFLQAISLSPQCKIIRLRDMAC